MDVRCERCGTEYEFDEARISEAGVAVRCTTCSHVFKVRRPAAPAASQASELSPLPLAGEKPRDWKVRQPNGNVFTFRELTTLQRWIVERKVFRDDEISLTGETWKRLGNIPELASFFQVVEAADRAALLAASAPAAQPVAVRPQAPAPIDEGTPAWMAAPTPAPTPQPVAPVQPQPAPRAAAPAPAPSPQHTREPAFARNAPAAADLDEADLAVVRGGGKGKLIGGLVAAAALAAGGYFYVQKQSAPVETAAQDAIAEAAPAQPAPPEPPPAVATPDPVPEDPAPAADPAPPTEPAPALAVAVADETKADPVPAAASEPVAAKVEEKDEKAAPAEPKLEEKAAPTTEAKPAAASNGVPKGHDFDWYIQQAFRMRELNKPKAALDYYARADELKPNSPEPHAGMGYALIDLGNLNAAIQAFETALRKNPQYGEALLGLAEAWKEKRDKKKAIDYYRQYIDAVPDGPEVGIARRNIERLSQK